MEDLVMQITQPTLDLRGKRVLVTGHTGFKGSWLCEWLLRGGARLFGIALPPESAEALFVQLRLQERLDHTICDIRDSTGLDAAVQRADPEIIFHLAAQPLVRRSYREPVLTWHTNVIGTLNVLEATRKLAHPVTVIAITTDKVYKNHEWEYSYREDDELGGHDPYSASKAACELALASWRASFSSDTGVTVIAARAGNVLGGGDYSEDRIIPDCFRAWRRGDAVELRRPHSTRPWQHVLEPLSGYIALAAHALTETTALPACNFGPGADGVRSVAELVSVMASFDATRRCVVREAAEVHEARSLSLCIDRARQRLGWTPRLSFEETAAWTNEGYTVAPTQLIGVVQRQIDEYEGRRSAAVLVRA